MKSHQSPRIQSRLSEKFSAEHSCASRNWLRIRNLAVAKSEKPQSPEVLVPHPVTACLGTAGFPHCRSFRFSCGLSRILWHSGALPAECRQSWWERLTNPETNQPWRPPRLIKAFLWRPGRNISIQCMHLNLYVSNQEEVELILMVMTRWAAEANLSQRKQTADDKRPEKQPSVWETLQICFVSNLVASASTSARSKLLSALVYLCAVLLHIHENTFTCVYLTAALVYLTAALADESCQFQTQPGFQLPSHHTAILQMLAYLLFYTYMYICQCKYA